MTDCPAIMRFGDDFGDNCTTFHCGLPGGHDGPHVEESVMYGEFPYRLEWTKTMEEEDEVLS